VFGPSKLSELGKGLGDGIRNFKKAVNDDPGATAQAAPEKKDNATPTA
jgi:Sec-independent protein translocase protein TatA